MENRLWVLAAINSLLALALTSCGPSGQVAIEDPASHSGPLAITSATLPTGYIGQPFYAQLTAQGGAKPYTWSIFSGELPDGLSLDPTTGEITGTPTHGEEVAFTAYVRDSSLLAPQTAWATFSTVVTLPPLAIVTDYLPPASRGHLYRIQLTAVGGTPPYFWSLTDGALPPGLELDPATGQIAGIPSQEGDFGFTIRVEDSATPPATLVARFGGHPATR